MLDALKKTVYEANMRLRDEGLVVLTWGADAMKAVDNAVSIEEIAKMARLTEELRSRNPGKEVPACISEKHFMRKHGPGAYYGQT